MTSDCVGIGKVSSSDNQDYVTNLKEVKVGVRSCGLSSSRIGAAVRDVGGGGAGSGDA